MKGIERALERANPCLDRLLLLFWVQYIKGWSSFTRFAVGDYLLQITKERMLLITSKRRMLQFPTTGGKVVERVTLHTWEV